MLTGTWRNPSGRRLGRPWSIDEAHEGAEVNQSAEYEPSVVKGAERLDLARDRLALRARRIA